MSVTDPRPKPARVDSDEVLRKAAETMGPDADDTEGDEFDDTEFVPVETPEDAEAPDEGEPAPPVARPAAKAAPAAPAGQPPAPVEQPAAPDIWAETEDVEYEDGDTGEKYVARVPKAYADKIRTGYQRRSYTDRKLSSLGQNRKWLEPLMESGQLDRMAPYLQEIVGNPDMQNVVAEAFNRRAAGKPLQFMDEAVRQIQQTQAPAPARTTAALFDENALRNDLKTEGYDDYTVDAIVRAQKATAERFESELGELRGRFDSTQQTLTQQQQAAQQQQAEIARIQQVGAQARTTLVSWYPELEKADGATWDRIEQYAHQSGMIQQMGFAPGTFVAAYQRMREQFNPANTAAPSTAATTVAQAEAQARALAASAAQRVGAATATNGAAVTTPAAPRRVKIPTHRKDERTGRMIPLSPTEVAKEMEKRGA